MQNNYKTTRLFPNSKRKKKKKSRTTLIFAGKKRFVFYRYTWRGVSLFAKPVQMLVHFSLVPSDDPQRPFFDATRFRFSVFVRPNERLPTFLRVFATYKRNKLFFSSPVPSFPGTAGPIFGAPLSLYRQRTGKAWQRACKSERRKWPVVE